MKNKQTTIVQVAKAAGVSIATVSNVLNRRNVPLTEETIRKVEEAAESLGYRRNVMAANLSRKRTYELGLIIPGFGGYYGEFAQRMQETVHACGYHLSVFSASGNPELEQRHLEMLLQRRVDGLFCHGLAMAPELTRRIVGEGTPMVLFNAWDWPEDLALGAVNLDFAGGSRDAVLHLYERGCRSIYYLGQRKSRGTDTQRRLGFQRGLDSLGGDRGAVTGRIIETYDRSLEDCIAEILKHSGSGTDAAWPIGILAFDDQGAFALTSKLQEVGYRVPEQFKVMGINNQAYSQLNYPSITSLDIAYGPQVLHAVHRLLSHLGDGERVEALQAEYRGDWTSALSDHEVYEIPIPMKLIARRSTER